MIDPRMQKLIAALSGRGGAAGRGGVSGGVAGGLPTYGASSSPYGAGGMFSNPVSFNPFGAQTALGFQGLQGPSQGADAAVNVPNGGGPAQQGIGDAIASPGGDAAPQAPGFYGSSGDAMPSSPWMPSTGTPNASVSIALPGQGDQTDVLGRILSRGRQL